MIVYCKLDKFSIIPKNDTYIFNITEPMWKYTARRKKDWIGTRFIGYKQLCITSIDFYSYLSYIRWIKV